MSGKKSKQQQPLFRQCSKCALRVLNSALEEHLNGNCGQIYPSFLDSALHVKLAKLPPTSKCLSHPAFQTVYSDSILFLPEVLIFEAGFKTFEWVFLRMNGSEKPGDEYVLRIWPISESSGLRGNVMRGFMTQNGIYVHPNLKLDEPIIIRTPDDQSNCLFPICPTVKELYIKIDRTNISTIGANLEEKLIETIEISFHDRIVFEGNVFQVKFYTELVSFSIEKIVSDCPKDDLKFTYYEITKNTNIKAMRSDSEEKSQSDTGETSLEDVGGLEPVIKEISSTIECVLKSPVSNPFRGILLYGHYGTGKSLLVQAICNSFGLNTILVQENPVIVVNPTPYRIICKSLDDAFNESLVRAPCAIIIEDLETLDTSDPSSNLSATLRGQFDRLDSLHARVIVLATTSDLDSIDLSVRSSLVFGREIELPIPGPGEREDIMTKMTCKMKHILTSANMKQIAESTHGFVGADLRALCLEAGLSAFRNRQDYSFDMKDIEAALKTVRPSAMKGFSIEVPNVKWSDIGGQEDLKFKLKQGIEWPLKHPEAFDRLGITPPKGYLMYGPPGCSKTMIAKAIATESGLNFISAKGSEIFNKWVGESEKAIQNLFRKARQVAPSILFFDEIDSLGGERGNSSTGSSVNERVLSQLLVEIDGIELLHRVIIVAATNRPDIIDRALIRPGRLDRIIYVPLPDTGTRADIFRIRFKGMPVDVNLNVDHLVVLTDGYSGAEITAVCQEAALKALEEDINSKVIREKHFEEALKIVKPRISPKQIEFYENYSKSRQMS